MESQHSIQFVYSKLKYMYLLNVILHIRINVIFKKVWLGYYSKK